MTLEAQGLRGQFTYDLVYTILYARSM